MSRFAIGRQPHHLELIAVLHEAEILGHCEVQQPERMREKDLAAKIHAAATADSKRGTDEVTKAINGANCSFFERRDEKAAGQMCGMVLDIMQSMRNRRALQSKIAGQCM